MAKRSRLPKLTTLREIDLLIGTVISQLSPKLSTRIYILELIFWDLETPYFIIDKYRVFKLPNSFSKSSKFQVSRITLPCVEIGGRKHFFPLPFYFSLPSDSQWIHSIVDIWPSGFSAKSACNRRIEKCPISHASLWLEVSNVWREKIEEIYLLEGFPPIIVADFRQVIFAENKSGNYMKVNIKRDKMPWEAPRWLDSPRVRKLARKQTLIQKQIKTECILYSITSTYRILHNLI